MSSDIKKMTINNVDVVTVESEADFNTCLRSPVKDIYILYQVRDRRTLLRISNEAIFHCDIPYGRPLTDDVKKIIQNAKPGVMIHDVSHGQRRLNLSNPGGFWLHQELLSLPQGIQRLAECRVESSNNKSNSPLGLFSRTEFSSSSVSVSPSNKIIKP